MIQRTNGIPEEYDRYIERLSEKTTAKRNVNDCNMTSHVTSIQVVRKQMQCSFLLQFTEVVADIHSTCAFPRVECEYLASQTGHSLPFVCQRVPISSLIPPFYPNFIAIEG